MASKAQRPTASISPVRRAVPLTGSYSILKRRLDMPANVESMFSVRQLPWHREGVVLPDYPGSWVEARKLAGLDWEPVTTAVYAVVGVNPDGSEHFEPIEGW